MKLKKSSKFEEASKIQLLYYLRELEKAGINAKGGVLLYPEERKRIDVELTRETILLLEETEKKD